ncbi:hypothetical protein BJ878DRAFT_483251 [Calycina marina]|uniref:Uncharacterized protein n=1 Tax=Calycina marina TaxID=1763456 RepID=A0A9P8CBZ2_9HELO|nr:hypothetical protein BJ878DRAFT_483251 [Calycina marina]
MAAYFQCAALNVSDNQQCLEEATTQSDLFGLFHARLAAAPPAYFANSKEAKAREDQKRQDELLNKIPQERLNTEDEGVRTDDSDFDPIEDVLDDKCNNFIALFQRFLWMTVPETASKITEYDSEAATASTMVDVEEVLKEVVAPLMEKSEVACTDLVDNPVLLVTVEDASADEGETAGMDNQPAKPSHSKDRKLKPRGNAALRSLSQRFLVPDLSLHHYLIQKALRLPEENRSQLAKRLRKNGDSDRDRRETRHWLKNDTDYNLRIVSGILASSIDSPVIHHKFLANERIPAAELQDLCQKIEYPGLQDMRYACANLFHPDQEEEYKKNRQVNSREVGLVTERNRDIAGRRTLAGRRRGADPPNTWISKRELAKAAMSKANLNNAIIGEDSGGPVNFGDTGNDKPVANDKIQIKFCGIYIWNNSSGNLVPFSDSGQPAKDCTTSRQGNEPG